ncbi:hypothetical protein SEVIR_9G445001v4 [Setaria viridis]
MMLPFCGRRGGAVLAAVALSSYVVLLHAFALPAASALGVGLAGRHRRDATPGAASCDVFSGSWVLGDASASAYTGYNCPLIDAEFNCQLYGRPDSDYLRYRWKPAGCELPRFDGADFLTRMKGKTVMFVGDSLGRNQWESLVCLLHAAAPQSPAQLVSSDPLYNYKFLVCTCTARRVYDYSELGHRRDSEFTYVRAGVRGDGLLLPRAVSCGHRRGPGEEGPDAGRHHRERRGVARRRRALLQLRPLVDAHRRDAGVGLHGGGRAVLRGHGPDGGVPARPHHLGQLGGPQRRPGEDPCLLPGHVAHALQFEGVAQPGIQKLLRRDDSGGWAQFDDHHRPGLIGPGAGDPGRAAGDEEPRPPPRHHGAVGDAEGRAPVGVQRRLLAGAARQPRRLGGLQPLVPPRPPGHLEPALLHPPLLQVVAAQQFTHRAASS